MDAKKVSFQLSFLPAKSRMFLALIFCVVEPLHVGKIKKVDGRNN